MLHFLAIGVAQPKGSTRAFVVAGRARVTSDNRKNSGWQSIVAFAAGQALRDQPDARLLEGPVTLYASFHLKRPKDIKAKQVPHTKKPDLDKLLRSVKDALTGVCWHDDSQVARIVAAKRYVAYGQAPFVDITLMEEDSQL